MINKEYFEFFKKLAANNNKEWFDAHKKEYETQVKIPFENLVSDLISEIQSIDKSYNDLFPKDCIFRINRDIRFSADKTPYKLNRSAIIAPGGRKYHKPAGFYMELGPGGCGFYAGAYMPEKKDLLSIRRLIRDNADQFKSIISEKEFREKFGEVQGEKNKRLDPEFREAAEKQPLIYNTQYYIMNEFTPEMSTKKDFIHYIISLYLSSRKFNEFLLQAYDE